MRKFAPLIHRCIACFLFVMAAVLMLPHPASAQRAIPEPALLPDSNPLCDGLLVPCLVMDDFAGHAFLQPQLLPATDLRDTAAVFPFGIALGLAGRVAGGRSTHFAFWKEGNVLYQQLGPLRLSLTVRLLPICPLWAGSGDSEDNETGRLDYAPPRGFRLGLSYEHEVRVWRFLPRVQTRGQPSPRRLGLDALRGRRPQRQRGLAFILLREGRELAMNSSWQAGSAELDTC